MSEKTKQVVFGTGPAGMAVMDELLARGKQIRMINRSGKVELPEGVELLNGDVSDPDFAREACKSADMVYNCINAPYDKWPELFPPLQKGIVEGAASVKAKLVVLENVYMYGPTHGKPMTEDMPYSAKTRKGITRANMADELMQAHVNGRVQVVIGRASDFFGPRVRMAMMGERLFPMALKGKKAQVLGNPDKLHTQTYIKDIGKGLVILGENESAFGQIWHLPSTETITTRKFIELVYQETVQTPVIQAAPRFVVSLLGFFDPIIRELKEILYQTEEDFIVDHTKFENAFGNHATPLDKAIRETVSWFRENPSGH